MESKNKRSRTETFFSVLKNIFIVLLFLQFAPMILSSLKNSIKDSLVAKTHVGYLTINGVIDDSAYYVKKIDEFYKDPDIKALLIKINSPGGYTGSSQIIFNELKRFKKEKPVVALIENVGASGAYYVALAAHSIIASPISLVGSIGIFMELPNVKELLGSWKVSYRYVQSGTYKTVGSMVKDVSNAELAYLQNMSDDQYNYFIKDVAACRNLVLKDHKTWADGKAFTGNQALKLKLIDKLGSFSDALEEVKRLAKIKDEIKLIQPKKPSGFMRLFAGDDETGYDQMSLAGKVAWFLKDVTAQFSAQQQCSQPSMS